MADTSDTLFSYAVDTAPTVALSGAIGWQSVNLVSEDLDPASDTVMSKVIRPTADLKEVRRYAGGFSGTIAMELARDTELETLMAAALRGAWATNVLKAGVGKTVYVFEEKVFEGATPFYTRYRGAVLGGFALEVGTDGFADIRFPVSGRKVDDDLATIATSTYTAAGSAPVLAGVDFTGFNLTALTAQLDVERVTIDMTNNLRSDRKLGSPDPRAINWGKRTVAIEATFYFASNEMLQKFKADPITACSFGFTVPGGTSGFDFQFDRVRITGMKQPVAGENNTIMQTVSMMATYDATNGTDFRITRRT